MAFTLTWHYLSEVHRVHFSLQVPQIGPMGGGPPNIYYHCYWQLSFEVGCSIFTKWVGLGLDMGYLFIFITKKVRKMAKKSPKSLLPTKDVHCLVKQEKTFVPYKISPPSFSWAWMTQHPPAHKPQILFYGSRWTNFSPGEIKERVGENG